MQKFRINSAQLLCLPAAVASHHHHHAPVRNHINNAEHKYSKETLPAFAGAEMYLRQLAQYGLGSDDSGGLVPTFAHVAEVVRGQGETALGFVLKDGTVVTAPHAKHQQRLSPGDQVIVLAGTA